MLACTFAFAVGLGDAVTVVLALVLLFVLVAVLQAPIPSKLKRIKYPIVRRISVPPVGWFVLVTYVNSSRVLALVRVRVLVRLSASARYANHPHAFPRSQYLIRHYQHAGYRDRLISHT